MNFTIWPDSVLFTDCAGSSFQRYSDLLLSYPSAILGGLGCLLGFFGLSGGAGVSLGFFLSPLFFLCWACS